MRSTKPKQPGRSGGNGPSPALKFILSFIVALVVFGGIYAVITARYHDDLVWFLNLTASIAGGLASLIFSGVTWAGNQIRCQGFSVVIIDECTGLLEMVIYLAAVIAFSTTWKKKLIGLAAGIPAIYVFNVLRILVLLLVGSRSHGLFEFMHLYFWQATLIIMIATVWIGWLYLVVFREKKRTVAVSG